MEIDGVVKLGGSLLYNMEKAKCLLDLMYLNRDSRFVITVGSGYIGEMYKQFIMVDNQVNIPFNDSLRDYCNLQSINASILSGLNPNYIVCVNEQEIQSAFEKGKVPILDARGFMHAFSHDKYQKSDVRSANLCKYLKCNNLIIVTDVPGIYDVDPRKSSDAYKYDVLTAESLKTMGRTAVDEGLAERIIDFNLNCCVVGVDQLLLNQGRLDERSLGSGTLIVRGGSYEKTFI